MNNKIKVLVIAVCVLAFSSANARAYSEDDSASSVRYYSSSNCAISDSTNRDIYIDQKLIEELPLAEWISKNYAAVTSLSAEYGLPWEPIMAQGAIESNFGTSEKYESGNMIFALGPQGKGLSKETSYPDIESSWRAIFEYWRLGNNKEIFSEDAIYDPDLYISSINKYGYKPTDEYIENLRDLTLQIDVIIERSNLRKSGDIYKTNLAMKENIARNRGEGIDKRGNAVDHTSSECNCGGSSAASGLRWSEYWVANNSLFGSQKAMVIGSLAEGKIKANDYGLSLPKSNEFKIDFRIKNGDANLVNGDPYKAYPDGDYPHFLVDVKKKRIFQYFPINVSCATKINKNINNGIVIDIVGYANAGASSDYYLWDEDVFTGAEWKYLAKLVQGIYEQNNTAQLVHEGDLSDKIWDKMSSNLNLTAYKPSLKCGTEDGEKTAFKEHEARRLISYYEKTASTNEYELPNGSKKMPASFVMYFVNRFTNLNINNFDVGEPRDVVKTMSMRYPNLSVGNDPAPFAIFSSTQGSMLCEGFACGSTGVVLSIDNGLALTVEQSCPSGKLEVKKRSLADLKNQKYGASFVYLHSVIDKDGIYLGKQGL